MTSQDHHEQLNRVTVLLTCGCTLLLISGVLALRLLHPDGTISVSAQQSSFATDPPPLQSLEVDLTAGARIRTDRRVYPEPPLPSLPRAGGKFNDPVFGTQIMRVTDEGDYRTPGCGTWYSQWP